jgi:hypothetical protein
MRSALWVTPIVAIVLIYLLAPLMRTLESSLDLSRRLKAQGLTESADSGKGPSRPF